MISSGHYPKPECLCLQLVIFIFEFSLDVFGIRGTHLDFCRSGPKEKFWICRYFSSSALQLLFLTNEWLFHIHFRVQTWKDRVMVKPQVLNRLKALIQRDKSSPITHSTLLQHWPFDHVLVICFSVHFPSETASPLSQFLSETIPNCFGHFQPVLKQKKGLSTILGGQGSSNYFPRPKQKEQKIIMLRRTELMASSFVRGFPIFPSTEIQGNKKLPVNLLNLLTSWIH